MLMQISCSRPFYELLSQATSDPDALFDWVFCPYTITGLALTGVGLIILATVFIGLKNWTEGWTVPMTWLALTGPVLASAMLPGRIVQYAVGAIVLGASMIIIGAFFWWGRS